MERLPGQERLGDPPPLAVGVRGVLILLVGIWALASFARRANRGRGRSRHIGGGKGKKEDTEMLAGGFEGGKRVVGAVDHAEKILEGVLQDAPAIGAKSAA